MQPVEIYTTRYCPYCVAAKALLKRKGVTYKEVDVGFASVGTRNAPCTFSARCAFDRPT